MLNLHWKHHPTHVVVRVSGMLQIDHALAALDDIAARTAGATHLLIDMRGVTTLHRFTDQFALGEAAATKLRHLQKVASVVPEGRTTRNSERPARNAGLDLRVFESEEQALAWLAERQKGGA